MSARRDARFHVSGPVLWNHEITAGALSSKLLNRADGGKLHANRRRLLRCSVSPALGGACAAFVWDPAEPPGPTQAFEPLLLGPRNSTPGEDLMRTPAFVAAITKHFWLIVSLLLLTSAGSANSLAAENLIWRLGQRDLSDHEFTTWPNPDRHGPVVVEMGQGNEEKLWPKFHPGSANQEMGAHPYSYTLVFPLPISPRGLYYLEVDALFRHPRVPILRVEINGHPGDFYFSPQVSWALGDESDAFNPIPRSSRSALPSLPASCAPARTV